MPENTARGTPGSELRMTLTLAFNTDVFNVDNAAIYCYQYFSNSSSITLHLLETRTQVSGASRNYAGIISRRQQADKFHTNDLEKSVATSWSMMLLQL